MLGVGAWGGADRAAAALGAAFAGLCGDVGAHGVVCAGSALEAGADGDVERGVEYGGEFAGVVRVGGEGDDGDAAVGVFGAEDADAGGGEEEFEDLSGEVFLACVCAVAVESFVLVESREESGHAWRVACSGFEVVWESAGHEGVVGVSAGAALGVWIESWVGVVWGVGAWGDVEGADARRAEEGFVGGEGEEVGEVGLHVERDVSDGL